MESGLLHFLLSVSYTHLDVYKRQTQGEELQAATYAYAYYISEGNKMIESFIYARDTEPQSDVDQGFYWGLRNINGRERKIYNTFKVIDSKESLDKTKNLLSYTDLSSWTQIPGIKKSTFKNNRSIKNKWPLVQSTSLYAVSYTHLNAECPRIIIHIRT